MTCACIVEVGCARHACSGRILRKALAGHLAFAPGPCRGNVEVEAENVDRARTGHEARSGSRIAGHMPRQAIVNGRFFQLYDMK